MENRHRPKKWPDTDRDFDFLLVDTTTLLERIAKGELPIGSWLRQDLFPRRIESYATLPCVGCSGCGQVVRQSTI